MFARARRSLIGSLLLLASVWLLFRWWHTSQTPLAAATVGLSWYGQPHSRLASPRAARAVDVALHGTVRTLQGEPVSAALVCAKCITCPSLPLDGLTCAQSSSTGEYTFSTLGIGGFRVTATAEGYAPEISDDPIVLTAEERHGRFDIVLRSPGVEFSGTVIDAYGGPVADAIVHVLQREPNHAALVVRTQEDGHFVAWVRPAPTALAAEAPGYARSNTLLRTAPAKDISLTLIPSSGVRGLVVSAVDDTPLADVIVRAEPTSPMPARQATSDPTGHFEISALAAGQYVLVAQGPHVHGTSSEPVELRLGDMPDIVLTVRPARSVRGRVIQRSTEQPCTHGHAMLMDLANDATSGAINVGSTIVPIQSDGSVAFDGIRPSQYRVRVLCDKHRLADGPEMLTVGDKDLDELVWRVQQSPRIEVHVVDESNRDVGHAGFALAPPPTPGESERVRIQYKADAQGRATIQEPYEPGSYILYPMPGHQGEPVPFELRDDTDRASVTLKLVGRGTIVVHVSDGAGNAVDDVTVRAQADAPTVGGPPEGGTSTAGVPLEKGTFRIGPLGTGRYTVCVEDEANPPSLAGDGHAFDLIGGGLIETHVVLDRSASISGKVQDANGELLADVWVTALSMGTGYADRQIMQPLLHSIGRGAPRVLTTPDGRFTLGKLQSRGTYALRADDPHGTSKLIQDVRPGREVVVTLPSAGALGGTAMTHDGRTVQSFELTLAYPDEQRSRQYTVAVDKDRWRVSDVNPGTIQLSASDATTGLVAGQQVTLGSGEKQLELSLLFSGAPQAMAEVETHEESRSP